MVGAVALTANEKFMLERYKRTGGSGLDHGCGDGRLVGLLASDGYDFWGAESYYGSEDFRETSGARTAAGARDRIRLLGDDFRIPFDDDTFDFVCSNQVIEHVEDLRLTVRELARVTKRGGVGIHLFPVRETVVEPHLGVPLYHCMPSSLRRPLARRWHKAGRANFCREEPDFDLWYRQLGPFFESSVRLRPARTVLREMKREFEVRPVEIEKLAFHRGHAVPALPGLVPLEHRRVGMAVEARRPAVSPDSSRAVSGQMASSSTSASPRSSSMRRTSSR